MIPPMGMILTIKTIPPMGMIHTTERVPALRVWFVKQG